MVAIAGFISTSAAYDGETVVTTMLARMSRPQGQTEVLHLGNIVLGCLRPQGWPSGLSSKPEARIASVSRGDVLNHLELRSLASEHIFTTDTQAESLMAAFATRGMDSLLSHNGPCTLAFHNARQGLTHIIRDRYGELTLHYTAGEGYFAFASEMKALLALVPARLNNQALSYRAFEFCVGKETLFRDIWSLEPGDVLKVKDDGTYHISSWWRIWEHLEETPDTEEKAIAEVLNLLEDATKLRVQGCSQHACMLSGGIDSSLVACMVKPDMLYHAHYDFADFNELEYARCVANHLGKELRLITPQKEDFIKQGDAILYTLDSPCTWTSFTMWMMLKSIHADGIHTLFTGDGADELFGGYHRYHLLYHDEQIRHLEAMQQYSYLIERYYGSRVERYAKLVNRNDNSYDAQVNDYLRQLLNFYDQHSNSDVVNFMSLTDFYTTSQVLFHMTDRIFSHFAMRNRSPFMDYRLVQLAFSLGTHFKINEGVTKWVLRKAAQRYLPDKILRRTDKRGFSAPVNRWFHWDSHGRYNRSGYKNAVFTQWQRLFTLEE